SAVSDSALAEELEALGPVAPGQHLVHRDPALAARGLVLGEVALVDALTHELAAAGEAQTLLGAAVGLLLRHGAVLLHIWLVRRGSGVLSGVLLRPDLRLRLCFAVAAGLDLRARSLRPGGRFARLRLRIGLGLRGSDDHDHVAA